MRVFIATSLKEMVQFIHLSVTMTVELRNVIFRIEIFSCNIPIGSSLQHSVLSQYLMGDPDKPANNWCQIFGIIAILGQWTRIGQDDHAR